MNDKRVDKPTALDSQSPKIKGIRYMQDVKASRELIRRSKSLALVMERVTCKKLELRN